MDDRSEYEINFYSRISLIAVVCLNRSDVLDTKYLEVLEVCCMTTDMVPHH
jgi:hypothetical protein